MILRTIRCGLPSPLLFNGVNGESPAECKGWNETYAGIALLVVSVVFFLFTSCMLFEQIDAIKTNTSKIARMKMSVGHAGTELRRVTEEFNEMFGGDSNEVALHWFLPTRVEFPDGMKKVVLGYDWDETFDAVPYQEPGDIESGSISNSNDTMSRRIEMTSVPSSAASSSNVSSTIASSSDRPKLVKRNSRDLSRDYDKDDPLRPSGGTLT